MMTMRSHDQFNTSIYGLDDRYRGIHNGRRVVFLNPDDVRSAGLREGQTVDLISHFAGVETCCQRRLYSSSLQHSQTLRGNLLSRDKCIGAAGQRCR